MAVNDVVLHFAPHLHQSQHKEHNKQALRITLDRITEVRWCSTQWGFDLCFFLSFLRFQIFGRVCSLRQTLQAVQKENGLSSSHNQPRHHPRRCHHPLTFPKSSNPSPSAPSCLVRTSSFLHSPPLASFVTLPYLGARFHSHFRSQSPAIISASLRIPVDAMWRAT